MWSVQKENGCQTQKKNSSQIYIKLCIQSEVIYTTLAKEALQKASPKKGSSQKLLKQL